MSSFYDNNEFEEKIDRSLRPDTLDKIIGREDEKRTLRVMIQSANLEGRSLDHVLFYGPPGLGKTSMSMVIAKELGVNFHVTSGPAIEKQGDLAAILNSLDDKSVLFIDEIHRLKKTIEEILYPAMEDGFLDIIIGSGSSAKNIRIELPRFTLIGATTRLSMLSSPLQDRFGIHFHLDFYNESEIEQIIMQKAGMLKIDIEKAAALEIAKRSRKTARVAIRILKRAYDLAIVSGKKTITLDITAELFKILSIDTQGLDKVSRNYLNILVNVYNSIPTGLTTIAAALGEDEDTVESSIEPYLLREGLIMKTSKGRVPTDKSINLLRNEY